MVVVSLLPHVKFGRNDRRKDALHFIFSMKSCRFKQQAEQMDADLPNPFSFNNDDVIFRV